MSSGERMWGGAWLVVAAVAAAEAARLGVGPPRQPGPGFFPAVMAGLLAILTVAHLTRRTPGEPGRVGAAPRGLVRVGAVVGGLLAYALLLERLGFVLSTFALVGFLLGVVQAKRWTVALGFAAATAGVTYILFDRLLHAQLPRGLLEQFGF